MKCTHCGAQYEGSTCHQCGYPANAAPQKNLRSLLIDQSETIYAVLGSSLARTFLTTGQLGNGFSILTDKRVYFKGKCLKRKGKGFYFTTEERTVDLKDVTGTGFVHSSAPWALMLCYICLIFPVAILLNALLNGKESESIALGFMATLVIPATFYIIYKLRTYACFEIAYAGGGIAFDLRWINKEEVSQFQKQLVLLKQKEKTEPAASESAADIPKLLLEYKKLLDEGVISEAEFNAKKAELLSK